MRLKCLTHSFCVGCNRHYFWTVAARLRLDLCEGLLRQVKKKGWVPDGCGEEGREGAEGEPVGMSIATSSLGCGQHTRHIVPSVLSLPSSPSMPPSSTPPLPKSILPHLSTANPHAGSLGQLNKHVKSFQLPSKALLFLQSCIFYAY